MSCIIKAVMNGLVEKGTPEEKIIYLLLDKRGFKRGSNPYLLSDEITTKLTGRYLAFETYPLDFEEYEEMKRFYHSAINEDRYDEFNEYMLNGGFPKSLEFPDIHTSWVYPPRNRTGKI